jgi:hypothetical protein
VDQQLGPYQEQGSYRGVSHDEASEKGPGEMRCEHGGFLARDHLNGRIRNSGSHPRGLPSQRKCSEIGSMMSMSRGGA